MSLRPIGKVVYFYALFVSVMALLQTMYDANRHPEDTSSVSGLGIPHTALFYPVIWAGNFAEKFTAMEQVCGFAAIFILFGIIAIIAKVTEQNRRSDAANTPPRIEAKQPTIIFCKVLCIASHLAVFLDVGLFLPLIVYLVMQDGSEFVANNAKEAMMFQVSLIIYFMCSLALTTMSSTIAGLLFFALGIGYLVFSIIASIQASKGRCYHYPLTLWFLRSVEVGRII